MVLFRLKKEDFKSIADLEIEIGAKLKQRENLTVRKSSKILIIDDQPVDSVKKLESNGYNVTVKDDIYNFRDVEGFNLIMCDLQGVGKSFNKDLQGAHLIREIKKNYPYYPVIAFTGIAANQRMARIAEKFADEILKKDAETGEWNEMLDKYLWNYTDPIFMWKRFRSRLLDSGVSPIDLAHLEDQFVRNYSQGQETMISKMDGVISKQKLSNDVRAIVQGFVSSLIFKLVIG